MNVRVGVTGHALKRIRLRTESTVGAVIQVLNLGLYTQLGACVFKGRYYRYALFYIQTEDRYYIAVFNKKCNRLVSVWKPRYHTCSDMVKISRNLRMKLRIRTVDTLRFTQRIR